MGTLGDVVGELGRAVRSVVQKAIPGFHLRESLEDMALEYWLSKGCACFPDFQTEQKAGNNGEKIVRSFEAYRKVVDNYAKDAYSIIDQLLADKSIKPSDKKQQFLSLLEATSGDGITKRYAEVRNCKIDRNGQEIKKLQGTMMQVIYLDLTKIGYKYTSEDNYQNLAKRILKAKARI